MALVDLVCANLIHKELTNGFAMAKAATWKVSARKNTCKSIAQTPNMKSYFSLVGLRQVPHISKTAVQHSIPPWHLDREKHPAASKRPSGTERQPAPIKVIISGMPGNFGKNRNE